MANRLGHSISVVLQVREGRVSDRPALAMWTEQRNNASRLAHIRRLPYALFIRFACMHGSSAGRLRNGSNRADAAGVQVCGEGQFREAAYARGNGRGQTEHPRWSIEVAPRRLQIQRPGLEAGCPLLVDLGN